MIKIIQGDSRHHNFILNSWLQSYFAQMKVRPSKELYYKEHEPLIKKCLERSSLLIAINETDEDQYLGYLVHEKDLIHFCYVKVLFQKQGIASLMMKEVTGKRAEFSHYTPAVGFFRKYRLSYNPYGFYKQ